MPEKEPNLYEPCELILGSPSQPEVRHTCYTAEIPPTSLYTVNDIVLYYISKFEVDRLLAQIDGDD
jgi:hypothetical protein